MSGQLPESAKEAIQQLTGPRYRPGAYPLLALAKDAIAGHAAIAEKVREHAELVAQRHAEARRSPQSQQGNDGAAAAGGA